EVDRRLVLAGRRWHAEESRGPAPVGTLVALRRERPAAGAARQGRRSGECWWHGPRPRGEGEAAAGGEARRAETEPPGGDRRPPITGGTLWEGPLKAVVVPEHDCTHG